MLGRLVQVVCPDLGDPADVQDIGSRDVRRDHPLAGGVHDLQAGYLVLVEDGQESVVDMGADSLADFRIVARVDRVVEDPHVAEGVTHERVEHRLVQPQAQRDAARHCLAEPDHAVPVGLQGVLEPRRLVRPLVRAMQRLAGDYMRVIWFIFFTKIKALVPILKAICNFSAQRDVAPEVLRLADEDFHLLVQRQVEEGLGLLEHLLLVTLGYAVVADV